MDLIIYVVIIMISSLVDTPLNIRRFKKKSANLKSCTPTGNPTNIRENNAYMYYYDLIFKK